MTDYKAQQAARAVAAAALQAANPNLVPVGGKVDALQAAAKNIRIELAAAFPGVKFSVKSRRFSGGDAIDVSWTDGPNSDQVDEIIDRYSAGSFDGMEDIYRYERNAWRDAFGDAKYIFGARTNSPKAIESALRTVFSRYSFDVAMPSAADFLAGRCYAIRPTGGGNFDLQSLVHQVACKRTWMLNRKPAAREEVAA